jgi:hypothetical protein
MQRCSGYHVFLLITSPLHFRCDAIAEFLAQISGMIRGQKWVMADDGQLLLALTLRVSAMLKQ